MVASPFDTVQLMGVPFSAVTEDQAIEFVVEEATGGRGGVVITPNVDLLRLLNTLQWADQLLAPARLVLADGQPIVWASRLVGKPLPCRVTGSSVLPLLCRASARAGLRVAFIGGQPGSGESARALLAGTYPDLEVVLCVCPEVTTGADTTIESIRRDIAATRPDIVFTGLGSPKQEWVNATIGEEFPQAWFIGIGAGLDMLAGRVTRAPARLQAMGAEWLWRLALEPRRLFRRYIIHDIPFAARLFGAALLGRWVD